MKRVSRGVLVVGVAMLVGAANASLYAGGGEAAPAPVPQAAAPAAQVPDYWTPPQNNSGAWAGSDESCDRFYARLDALLWWTKGSHLPPLVTTSPAGTPQTAAGVLGQPGTTVLFGDQTVGDDFHPGIRASLGMWLDSCHTWALEADYLTLFQEGTSFDSGPRSDSTILARPFFDLLPRDAAGNPTGAASAQNSELVSFPGVLSGRVTARVTDDFQSAGVWVRHPLLGPCGVGCDDPCSFSLRRLDLIAGYRFYRLGDGVTINEDLVGGAGSGAPGTSFLIQDTFLARNEFHGGEIGLATQFARGRWTLGLSTRVAIGNNEQTVRISGSTITTPAGGTPTVFNEGVLASRTNIGRFVRDDFVMIPELGLEMGYQWNCHFRTYAGYNILYWANVMRAADQINLNVDTGNLPPAINPSLPFPSFPGLASSFWAQGINFGAEWRY